MGLDSADKVWKKDETAALIALYESEKCLYDKKDKNYHDFVKRSDAYEKIREVMLRIRPDCSVSEIKNRIKYLRSQYTAELLRRNISIDSCLCTEDSYKPVMWCFGLLQFLDDFISIKKTASKTVVAAVEKNEKANVEEDKQNENVTPLPHRNPHNHSDAGSSSDATDRNGDLEDIHEKKSRKKRKVENISSSESTMDSPEKAPAQSFYDREDIFGQYIASEMRALRDDPLLYLQTKQSILEILTSANFQLINPE